jgi:uncharacterized protein YcbK (DUF882 family)
MPRKVRDWLLEKHYDWTNENPPVKTIAAIDKIYDSFEKVSFRELDKDYLDKTLSNDTRFIKMLQNSTYCIVPQSELNRRIVGNFRVKNFIAKDSYYKQCIMGKRQNVVWLMNKKAIHKLLELQNELRKMGYNPNAMVVTNGHRPPDYNEAIKGANRSHHITGEAVDITVYDIDKNGIANMKDKKIVLELLDKKIIKNIGGVGLYPGTQALHFDVRGKKARWNSFKR